MKTKKELLELRSLYMKRKETSMKNITKFQGKAGEQEWVIQFYMARGKVEILDHILDHKLK